MTAARVDLAPPRVARPCGLAAMAAREAKPEAREIRWRSFNETIQA